MKKSIMVYDRTGAYVSFFKRNLKDEFQINDYLALEKTYNLNIEDCEGFIFIMNFEIELIDLFWIFTKVKNLIMFTDNKIINERLSEYENVTLLDINKNKDEILKDVKFSLYHLDKIKML